MDDAVRNFISFHYDGPIAANHQLTARTLGSTLVHLQSAIDRAVIDLRYGVHKHARLKKSDYIFTDFELGRPKDGGYILDLVNSGSLKIIDRINAAIKNAYGMATNDAASVFNQSLAAQALHQQEMISAEVMEPQPSTKLFSEYGATSKVRKYADRAINKEIDQMLTQLKVSRYAGSTLELSLAGSNAFPIYKFDKRIAENFHRVVSNKTLGDPVLLQVLVRAMDGGTRNGKKSGKVTYLGSNRDFILHFRTADDFNVIAPYMRAGDDRPVIWIVAAPVIEYGTFDVEAGDMYFLGIA